MFFEIKLIITNFEMTLFINSNGLRSKLREKGDFFGLIDFYKEMNSFENVIFFHELLTVFLESDKLIERDEIMISFEEVVCVIEIFVNL